MEKPDLSLSKQTLVHHFKPDGQVHVLTQVRPHSQKDEEGRESKIIKQL
jgi:hypothetical protein